MSDLKLGVLLSEDVAGRDAAHVAAVPVIADERLVPGAKVGLVKDGDSSRVGVRTKEFIGVVDPFLTEMVEIGQRFWLLMDPGVVRAIRHDWSHPAFDRAASVAWFERLGHEIDRSGDELIRIAKNVLAGGEHEYVHEGEDAFRNAGGWSAFWHHYGIVAGVDTSHVGDKEAIFFCC